MGTRWGKLADIRDLRHALVTLSLDVGASSATFALMQLDTPTQRRHGVTTKRETGIPRMLVNPIKPCFAAPESDSKFDPLKLDGLLVHRVPRRAG